jgi:replicative DNA helicase
MLQADGVLEKIGGANYLADLSDTLSEEETADPGFYGSSIITFAMIRERATSCMRVKVVID